MSELNIKQNVLLAPYTTWKIGGPAEYFAEASTTDELINLVKFATENKISYTILGWGSNVLVADTGIDGLVIRNLSKNINLLGECNTHSIVEKTEARLVQVDKKNYYSFSDLDYPESGDRYLVEVDSGLPLSLGINSLIDKGLTGLQWFAGIPGTIGGAVYNNIHGGSHFFEEYVESVTILNEQMELEDLSASALDFKYDYSRFHKTKEIILKARLCLFRGDKDRAKKSSIAWATKKKLQPARSAGCCFQNITKEEQTRLNLESNGWGYIIDKILNLKGTRIGGAEISSQHAAFIENVDHATAEDVIKLLELIYKASHDKLGITPKLEIFLLGFSRAITAKF